jgi:antitoxin component YwqK of YwqJK toxin-antitoxin module
MNPPLQTRIDRFKDGSIRAKGTVTSDGTLCGYWEWFRNDGTLMRSGHFENGEQVGEWITYNRQELPHKTTHFNPNERKKTP